MSSAEHRVCNRYKKFIQIFKKYVNREWIWSHLDQNKDSGRLLKI